MRQLGKKRRSIGIRGQMMWFLCLICLLLLGLFWFLSTQLLEPLYTKHIQKQLTAEAEMIVAEMDDAIAKGEILSYWAFGGIKVTNDDFFSQLGSDIYSNGELSSFCVDISDATLRTIKKYENLSYCSLHQKSFPDTLDDDIVYSTARQVRQYCRENGAFARVLPAAKPSAYNQLVVGRMTADGAYTVLVSTTLMHVSEAAFMLGAKGIQMGTVFAASKESVIHENYKNSIFKAKDIDSRVTGRSTGHPIRVLRNDMARKYLELEKSGAPFEELEQLTLGSLRKAVQEGDTKNGSLMAGQIAGMIKEERTCADIISSTVSEAGKLMNGVSKNE